MQPNKTYNRFLFVFFMSKQQVALQRPKADRLRQLLESSAFADLLTGSTSWHINCMAGIARAGLSAGWHRYRARYIG